MSVGWVSSELPFRVTASPVLDTTTRHPKVPRYLNELKGHRNHFRKNRRSFRRCHAYSWITVRPFTGLRKVSTTPGATYAGQHKNCWRCAVVSATLCLISE